MKEIVDVLDELMCGIFRLKSFGSNVFYGILMSTGYFNKSGI